jgi:hypothetical protein
MDDDESYADDTQRRGSHEDHHGHSYEIIFGAGNLLSRVLGKTNI